MMIIPRDNEYQDSASVGSLAHARALWLGLATAGPGAATHQIRFAFACPSPHVAECLAGFLRSALSAKVAAQPGEAPSARCAAWHVTGTTHRGAITLESLEHTFTALRRAATRYWSVLTAVHRLDGHGGDA